MSIHVGWPDLTQSRRKSLLRARDRVTELIATAQKLFIAYEAFTVRVSGTDIDEKVKKLNELIALIDAQFPEVRNMDGFNWQSYHPCTNARINKSLGQHWRSLAGVFSLWPWELQYFIENEEFAIETLTRLKNTNKKKRGTQK